MHTDKTDTILFNIKYANVSVDFGSTQYQYSIKYVPGQVRAFYSNIPVSLVWLASPANFPSI